jgi:arylsulfatase A-like enzyme
MNKLHRRLGRAALASLLLATAGTAPAGEAGETQPNILFIAVDDLKPLTGAYGNGKIITPNLDALAARSTIFTRAYTQYPVCGPSRTSLLTGLRPESNGVIDLKTRMRDVDPDILTLPQHFRNHGYQTAASGKIFDPRNVDSRDDDDPASWSIPYRQPVGVVDRRRDPNLAVLAIDAPDDQFVDGDINRRGIELLRDMAADPRPFFLAVGYKKPHLPFYAPQRFFDLYERPRFDLEPYQDPPRDSDASYIMNNNGELRSYVPTPRADLAGREYAEHGMNAGDQRELLHGYYAAVSFIDSLIGELLQALEDSGEAGNTIIVLWGDHGFHLGDHGLWGKHTTMEQANRVPLLISVPGYAPGRTAALVEFLDLFPTLAELAGLDVPAHLQGQSLVPVLADPAHDPGGVAISQYKRRGAYGYSMRTARYRYTEWVMPDGKVVYRDLYHLVDDPGETRNIAILGENQLLLDSLAATLRQNRAGLLRLAPGSAD